MNQPMPYIDIVRIKASLAPFLALTRLNQPADLALLLLPLLWGSWLASQGEPAIGPLILFVLSATALRCAAHAFNDVMEKRLLIVAPDSLVAQGRISMPLAHQSSVGLLSAAVLLLLPLPDPALYFAPLALVIAIAFPFIKRRTFLTQVFMGLGYAWTIPMAYAAQGIVPDKTAWLLFVAVLLWATAFTTLFAMSRSLYESKVGIGSLAQIMGSFSPYLVALLQLGAMVAIWLTARQAKLGIYPDLAMLTALALLIYQQYLIKVHDSRSGPLMAYHNNIWVGIALFCGFAFHFLCVCAVPATAS